MKLFMFIVEFFPDPSNQFAEYDTTILELKL